MQRIFVSLVAAILCFALLSEAVEVGVTTEIPEDEALWSDPSLELSLHVRIQREAQNETNTTLDSADFGISHDALAWCLKQGGNVSLLQYAYIAGPKVIGFGRKRAYCDMGVYRRVEIETLAFPFVSMAQIAYFNPIADFKWDRSRWGSPASQYCVESKGATLGALPIPELNGECRTTGWSRLPLETSPGLSNSCDFGDGSTIEPWTLLNGRFEAKARDNFRSQYQGRRCIGASQ